VKAVQRRDRSGVEAVELRVQAVQAVRVQVRVQGRAPRQGRAQVPVPGLAQELAGEEEAAVARAEALERQAARVPLGRAVAWEPARARVQVEVALRRVVARPARLVAAGPASPAPWW